MEHPHKFLNKSAQQFERSRKFKKVHYDQLQQRSFQVLFNVHIYLIQKFLQIFISATLFAVNCSNINIQRMSNECLTIKGHVITKVHRGAKCLSIDMLGELRLLSI